MSNIDFTLNLGKTFSGSDCIADPVTGKIRIEEKVFEASQVAVSKPVPTTLSAPVIAKGIALSSARLLTSQAGILARILPQSTADAIAAWASAWHAANPSCYDLYAKLIFERDRAIDAIEDASRRFDDENTECFPAPKTSHRPISKINADIIDLANKYPEIKEKMDIEERDRQEQVERNLWN